MLSKYKYKKIAEESLRNSLRLHSDSILLFENESYPSAFQLSVLSMEELAKAKWVDHCFDATVSNNGFPKKGQKGYDEFVKLEQDWLKLLYLHPQKQYALISREIFDYAPSFARKIKERKLEFQKQQSVYVGLSRTKGKVDTESRISVPEKKIKHAHAKQIISFMNHEFLEIFQLVQNNETYWSISELDTLISESDCPFVFDWPFRSGLKSRRWNKVNIAKYS